MRKTLYAITHINKDGMRTLTFANQGRNHYETEEKAEEYLKLVLKNNNEGTLRKLWGDKGYDSLEVRPVECYHHGDAVGIYFDK